MCAVCGLTTVCSLLYGPSSVVRYRIYHICNTFQRGRDRTTIGSTADNIGPWHTCAPPVIGPPRNRDPPRRSRAGAGEGQQWCKAIVVCRVSEITSQVKSSRNIALASAARHPALMFFFPLECVQPKPPPASSHVHSCSLTSLRHSCYWLSRSPRVVYHRRG